jgi:predicted transcriptional regulator
MAGRNEATARDVMSKNIVFCRDTEEIEDAVRIMEQKKIRRLPFSMRKANGRHAEPGDISHAASHEVSGEMAAAVSAHHA